VVMEVNSSPGLEGIEQATGVDVAGKIIEYLEKNATNGKLRDGASRWRKVDRIQY
jgi:ribosomal protein S6--L-glutamate ligase